jgi:hypothetical protein
VTEDDKARTRMEISKTGVGRRMHCYCISCHTHVRPYNYWAHLRKLTDIPRDLPLNG